MANYMPLVYNFDYDTPYLPQTTISPLENPYFMSTNSGPYRTHISSLGTAADDLVLSPVSTVVSPVSTIVSYTNDKGSSYAISPLLSPVAPVAPMYNNVEYLNVNNDPDLIKSVTKYFYEKTMNTWLYSDFEEVLDYLKIKGDKISVVKNKKELENNTKDKSMKDIEKKIEFITNHVMTKYDMKSFLKKYALKSGLDLWKLKENKKYVKKSIMKKLISKLSKLA